MAGLKLYIICLCIAADLVTSLSAFQGIEKSTYCLPERYCMRLFKLQYNVSWSQATGYCRDNGMEPLPIYNHTIQDEVMTVLNKSRAVALYNIDVWLAGQRNLNATWTSVDPDSDFHRGGSFIEEDNSDSKNCLTGTYMYSSNDSPIASYKAVSCSDTQTDNKLICKCGRQACNDGGKFQNGHYYMLVNDISIDWYRAQSVCQKRYGDLLHQLPGSYSDLGSLTGWLSIGDTAWIGTWRRSWGWNDKTGNDWTNMRYFNWASGTGGRFPTDTVCMVIDGDTGLWLDVSCHDTYYQYVLCMDENTNTSPSTANPPVAASTSSDTTTVNMGRGTSSFMQEPSDSTIDSGGLISISTSGKDDEVTTTGLNTLSDKGQTSGFRLVYIAVIVAVLVALTGIVLAVVFVRRCSMKKSASQEASDTGRPDVTANDYIDMEDVDNTRIPNQVLFSSNYQEVPDDLQVIYSKQNTAEQPPVGDTAVYALATGAATPGIQHIVTPQGDEYALPNKNSSSNVADAYGSAGFDSGEMSAANKEEDTALEKINSGNVSGAIGHLVTPEGDEYALPSRRVAPSVAAGSNPDDGEDIMVDSVQYGSLI